MKYAVKDVIEKKVIAKSEKHLINPKKIGTINNVMEV